MDILTKENTLGFRLKEAIKSLKMNQKEFADKTGILQSTLSGIITGKSPTSDTLKLISIAGINTHWLITGEGEPLLKQAAARSAGVAEVTIPLESEAGGGPVLQVEATAQTEPSPGFEQRREIAQLLVKLDIDNLFHVRRMIDALIAASQSK